MADSATIVQGDSVEAVAYALLLGVARSEDKIGYAPLTLNADAEWIFENYAKCLRAAKGLSTR